MSLINDIYKRFGCAIFFLALIGIIFFLSGYLSKKYVLNVIVTLILVGIIPTSLCMLAKYRKKNRNR